MKVGDLVRPKPPQSHDYKTTTPIVGVCWIGMIIDFTGDYYGKEFKLCEKGTVPIVYWNPTFNSEIESANQIEIISEA